MSRTPLTLLLVCFVFEYNVCAIFNECDSFVWPFKLVFELANYNRIIPEHEPVGKYTCTAELKENDSLSWYQFKESYSRHMLLSVEQNGDKLSNVTVVLDKTFEKSDDATAFYCVIASTKKIVRWFEMSIDRHDIALIEMKPAVVIIEPSSNLVYFDTGEILRFVCRLDGTKPLDGRKLTWYFETYESIDAESDLTTFVSDFEIPEHQEYDLYTNENVLELRLSSAHNLKKMFCAEDYSKTISGGNGTKKIMRFGQRAKSETFTLILKNQTFDKIRTILVPPKSINLAVVVAFELFLIIIISVSLITVIVKLKKKVEEFEKKERMWKRKPLETPNENTYDIVYSHGAGLKRKPF